jgi:hypothetical protein
LQDANYTAADSTAIIRVLYLAGKGRWLCQ